MGNCCGKEENFQGEGRTLGATPANAPAQTNTKTSAVPKISSSSGGRPLGGNTQSAADSRTPGAAAARAAEERLKASQGKGKLGKQLDAQKAQTQSGTLTQTARDNVAARDADAAQEARNWN